VKVIELSEIKVGGYHFLRGLIPILKDQRYDIVHVHGYGEYAGDIACTMRILARVKSSLILTTHGIAGMKHGLLALNLASSMGFTERIPRAIHVIYDQIFGRLQMGLFDRIVIQSLEELNYLSRIGLDRSKAIEISAAVNDLFLKAHSPRKDFLLYAGRIDKFKGLETVVRAIRALKSENLKMKCIIVGKDFGYRKDLELLINELDVADLIEIRDFVIQADLVELYNCALATVLPSTSEGFPLTILESMACGTPFIATPVGVIPELIRQSEAGLLINHSDHASLAATIRSLAGDEKKWHILSANCRLFVSNFTWEKITEKYYKVYSDMARTNHV
jgi:glycosyltransferase involved in cell wall biosynthesis